MIELINDIILINNKFLTNFLGQNLENLRLMNFSNVGINTRHIASVFVLATKSTSMTIIATGARLRQNGLHVSFLTFRGLFLWV